jgi:prepilin-type N-terminal cleavage/methylation domain-containing protein
VDHSGKAAVRGEGGRRAAGEPGFTLIELMIVIAIIAIIAAIAVPNLLAAKLSANETAAIATLRSIVSSQAQISTVGKIDADGDGRGEFGTFLEMTGTVGVRRGFTPGTPSSSDFSVLGPVLNPPVLSSVLARIDANGYVTKAGYAFILFLPDSSAPAGFVHETGPATAPGLAGGSGSIGVDLSEDFWCAYTHPVMLGNSGNRRFFATQRGDLIQSANDVAKFQGTAAVPAGNDAFRGAGITSGLAVGTVGSDGDVWKATN